MKKHAFTLAEILIALGVIGIVSVILISNYVSYYKERQNVAKLKKVYSSLVTAFNSARVEQSLSSFMSSQNQYSSQAHIDFRNYFMRYFKTKKVGGLGTSSKYAKIHVNKEYTSVVWDGNSWATFWGEDGVIYAFRGYGRGPGQQWGSFIYVILNPYDEYHEWGRDVFCFFVNDKGVYPAGYNHIKKPSFTCYSDKSLCAHWVLTYDNMDYLHCNDLSWNGKHSCK